MSENLANLITESGNHAFNISILALYQRKRGVMFCVQTLQYYLLLNLLRELEDVSALYE